MGVDRVEPHPIRNSLVTFVRIAVAASLGLALAPSSAFARTTRSTSRAPIDTYGDRALLDGAPADVGMDAAILEDAYARIARRAADGRFPGAVALVARHGVVVGERAFGVRVA